MLSKSIKIIVLQFLILFSKTLMGQDCTIMLKQINSLYTQSKFKECDTAIKKALTICQPTDDSYPGVLSVLSFLRQDQGNIPEAFRWLKKAVAAKEMTGKRDSDYIQLQENLALLYQTTFQLDSAIIKMNQVCNLRMQMIGHDSTQYAQSLDKLAGMCADSGEFDLAQKHIVHALTILSNTVGKNDDRYLSAFNTFGYILDNSGHMEYALLVYQSVLDIRKTRPTNNVNYAASLNNLAKVYQELGLHSQALKQFTESRDVLFALFHTKKNPDYITVLNNIAAEQESLNRYDEALLSYNETLKLIDVIYQKQNEHYANTLANLALLHAYRGEIDSAETELKEARDIREQISGRSSMRYLETAGNLSRIKADLNKTGEAMALANESEVGIRQLMGTKSSSYTWALENQAYIARKSGDHAQTGTLYRQIASATEAQLKSLFTTLNEADKEAFISELQTTQDDYASYVSLLNKNGDRSYNGWLYDNELINKGVLLSSNKRFLALLNNQNDPILTRQVRLWKNYKNYIAEQNKLPVTDRAENLDTITKKAESLERTLVFNSKAFGSRLEEFDISWKQVQGRLHEGEAAIEFLRYAVYKGSNYIDSAYFAALIIRPGQLEPTWVQLTEQRPLLSLFKKANQNLTDEAKVNVLYGTMSESEMPGGLYNLLWAPLDKYLLGTTRVYYAPAAQLNSVSLGSLRDQSGTFLAKKYDLVRLNSTRDILLKALRSDENDLLKNMKSAAVFGGIAYDLPSHAETVPVASGSMFIRGADGGDAWPTLPGSAIEGQDIRRILKDNGLNANYFQGSDASEENFKMMNSQSPDIIHLSTHGFFFKNQNIILNKTASVQENLKYAENPMMRSGLIMAGANQVWTGKAAFPGKENGILTANDVANLDLNHTKIVVLSACETGLGDNIGTEGVFGLQRAFKLAGVNKLIVSLWRISDNATPEFMKYFYTEWAKGGDIHDAFRNTQIALSKVYDPYKWAGFILVE